MDGDTIHWSLPCSTMLNSSSWTYIDSKIEKGCVLEFSWQVAFCFIAMTFNSIKTQFKRGPRALILMRKDHWAMEEDMYSLAQCSKSSMTSARLPLHPSIPSCAALLRLLVISPANSPQQPDLSPPCHCLTFPGMPIPFPCNLPHFQTIAI